MQPLFFVLVAFAPGVFWLWFFLRKDIYRPEPKRLLALTFFLGMVSTLPTGLLEFVVLDDGVFDGSASLSTVVIGMLLVVGPVEEAGKFLAVRLGAYRSLYFDEPGDGLVYSAAASLGFASLENLFYVIEYGPEVMIVRAPLSTLAHLICGALWGYALGRQKHERPRGIGMVLPGVAFGAAFHGVYNVAVLSFPLAAIAMTGAGLWWVIRRFNWAQAVSPFRYKRNYPRVRCASCDHLIFVTSRSCQFCGAKLNARHSALFCGFCGNSNRSGASYCTRCGDRLLV